MLLARAGRVRRASVPLNTHLLRADGSSLSVGWNICRSGKGLRLQAIAVWCRIQGAGFHCILREGAEELDNEARSILEIFNSRFNDLSIENLGTLFKFVHDGVRKADQSNRARRAKNFRDRLRRPDGFWVKKRGRGLEMFVLPNLLS